MNSKNKPAPTKAESEHLARLKELPCACCGGGHLGVEIHELVQGDWFTSIPLCSDCHRGEANGWHGRRAMWKLYKLDELGALNVTLRRLLA